MGGEKVWTGWFKETHQVLPGLELEKKLGGLVEWRVWMRCKKGLADAGM